LIGNKKIKKAYTTEPMPKFYTRKEHSMRFESYSRKQNESSWRGEGRIRKINICGRL
jgi:hypothetical protein